MESIKYMSSDTHDHDDGNNYAVNGVSTKKVTPCQCLYGREAAFASLKRCKSCMQCWQFSPKKIENRLDTRIYS